MTAPPHKTKPAQPLKTKPSKGFHHLPGPPSERKPPKQVDPDGGLDKYPKRKTLMQRGLHECCWPVTSGAPWFYCGEPTEGDSQYCAAHLHQRRDPTKPSNSTNGAKQLIRQVGFLK